MGAPWSWGGGEKGFRMEEVDEHRDDDNGDDDNGDDDELVFCAVPAWIDEEDI